MKGLILAVLCLFLSIGCSKPSATDDSARLRELSDQFQGRYSFEFDGDLYVRMKDRRRQTTPEEDAHKAYKGFWFDRATGALRRTNFVYLNVYGVDGAFEYQIAFDQSKRSFIRSPVEHY
jgi:hypothetical protein